MYTYEDRIKAVRLYLKLGKLQHLHIKWSPVSISTLNASFLEVAGAIRLPKNLPQADHDQHYPPMPLTSNPTRNGIELIVKVN